MAVRPTGRGIFYGRRSSDQQESSLETQLDWAIRTAKSDGIPLNVSLATLASAKATGQSAVGDLFIDDSVTGSDVHRPGWTACASTALSDPQVSHIYVYHRDRIARPDNPAEAASKEVKIVNAGIMIVFFDKRVTPTQSGEADVAHMITALLEYNNGHKFLTDLSNRVIESKRMLALSGFSAGGRAPYGFGRYLQSPTGELTYMPDGRRIRQDGHHVVILPHDPEKI
jgi:predicted site-specific integrase-resolvase